MNIELKSFDPENFKFCPYCGTMLKLIVMPIKTVLQCEGCFNKFSITFNTKPIKF